MFIGHVLGFVLTRVKITIFFKNAKILGVFNS